MSLDNLYNDVFNYLIQFLDKKSIFSFKCISIKYYFKEYNILSSKTLIHTNQLNIGYPALNYEHSKENGPYIMATGRGSYPSNYGSYINIHGHLSVQNSNSSHITCIGIKSLNNCEGDNNICVGNKSLDDCKGYNNICMGNNSLNNCYDNNICVGNNIHLPLPSNCIVIKQIEKAKYINVGDRVIYKSLDNLVPNIPWHFISYFKPVSSIILSCNISITIKTNNNYYIIIDKIDVIIDSNINSIELLSSTIKSTTGDTSIICHKNNENKSKLYIKINYNIQKIEDKITRIGLIISTNISHDIISIKTNIIINNLS